MKIELTIKVDYLPNWGLQEGVRELLQNAKDAEVEFSAPMSVRMRGETLVIENDGCTMPYEALLLGHSTKTGRDELIGKFGEGFKLGILALLRKGHAVKIRNGSEVWTPEIVTSEKFSARVLAFDIQKGRKDDKRIAIEVEGITPEFFRDEIKPRFLWLSKELGTNERVDTHMGTILLGDAFKGKVFVKGILVETKADLTVGYDLRDADVDRDRRMVDSYDFAWKTRCIWSNAVGQRPDLFGHFASILESNGAEVQSMGEHAASGLPDAFKNHMVEAFQKRHGSKAIPVSNLGESQDLEHFGRTGVVVNGPMKLVLENKLGTLGTVREALKNEVVRTYSWHELDDSQKANITRAVKLVGAVAPVSLDQINVVDYRSADLMGTAMGGAITLSATVASSQSKCLATLVHEVAHANGGDGDKGHIAEIERIWADIVEAMSN